MAERTRDWQAVYLRPAKEAVERQARRCMDCGVPFCHHACPLGNLVPEWNDLVRQGRWREASERLHATNNFPDFTGRLCPAPCEAACVLSIDPATTGGPVTIEKIEQEIAERAWGEGWLGPWGAGEGPGETPGRGSSGSLGQGPGRRKGGSVAVAVVGSGPAGLAAAQQLTRSGHRVTLYERADRIGGLLRYGIPEFKLEKAVLERRLHQMAAEGTEMVTGVEVGREISVERLRAEHEAVVLAVGSTVPRDLAVPGRELHGVHQAMEYLSLSNRVCEGDLVSSPIDARGLDAVIIGGGDTGADCLGTLHRQGAASAIQLEIMARPPEERSPATPWPLWPLMLRTSAAHEEGGGRTFGVSTLEILGDDHGRVRALRLVDVYASEGRFVPIEGSERELPCQLVLLALGFTGVEPSLAGAFGLEVTVRGTLARDERYASAEPGVFVAGDAGRGQSLVVWAIAEGRGAARAVDAYLASARRSGTFGAA